VVVGCSRELPWSNYPRKQATHKHEWLVFEDGGGGGGGAKE